MFWPFYNSKKKNGWRVWRLQVIIGSLLRRCLKHRSTLYVVGWHELAFMERRSSDDHFFPPLSFLSTSKGVLTLQSCKVVLNPLIVSNLIYLFFIIRHLTFYVFFYQIWSLLFWFLFILLLIFFYWILFFNLIPNHLIVFFLIWSSFLLLQFLLFWVLFLIIFFCNFMPYCLISLNFLIIFGAFFYHAFKTCPWSQPLSCPRLGRITGVTRVNQFFYYKESKNDIILIKK